jgi:hypothetical protein
MKWVFQSDCDPTRYLTISLKGMARFLASAQRPAILFLYSRQRTRVDCYIKFYRDRLFFLLLKPFLRGRMRFVAIETGQAMSGPQTPTTACHYFLKMTVPVVLCDRPGRLNDSHTC